MTEPGVRFAVVGCGVIGRLHAEVLSAGRHGTSVSVLVDPDTAAARSVADHVVALVGGEPPAVVASLAGALVRDDVDAVAVCAPSGLHAELSVQVLQAGRHVVVEKPVDVTVAAARSVAAAAGRARPGTVATVISQHRFDPASIAVHDAVVAGELGRLTSAVATVPWWRSQAYYDSADWRGTRALDGGSLMNQGVHTVDLLLWFLGRPVDVMARTAVLAHERVEVEDTVAAVVRFESGALATLHTTTAASPGLTVRVQVMGSAGSAVLDNDRLFSFHSALAADVGAVAGAGAGRDRGVGGDGNQAAARVGAADAGQHVGGGPGTSAMFPGHERQYRDVVEAIRTGRGPGVTIADGILALATVQAVYEAARTGAPVRISDVLDGRVVPPPAPPRSAAAVG